MKRVTIGEIAMEPKIHPVTGYIYHVELFVERGFAQLQVGDLRVLAATANAMADDYEKEAASR